MKTFALGTLACAALVCATALAAGTGMQAVNGSKAVQWGPAPPALPPGAQLAVMSGDPGAKGFVSLRAKLPAGYTIPPHTHPTDEHVAVLSGTVAFGMGDTVGAKTERTLTSGGYFVAQAGMHHYARTKTATVLQVDMEGPFEITYINPADDPRNKKK